MSMWNPWRGCRKCSEGCRYCYIHKGDAKRGVDTSIVEKNKRFRQTDGTLMKWFEKNIDDVEIYIT